MNEHIKMIQEDILPNLNDKRAAFESAAATQLAVWRGEGGPALLLHVSDPPDAARLPDYCSDECHLNSEKMFISQLKGALGAAAGGAQAVPSVRANMGCGVFATLFGLEQMTFPDKMPWLKEHLSKERLNRMSEEDIRFSPEFEAGLEHMRYMKAMLEGTGVKVYPMDVQGPVDVAHLVYGDDFFLDLYDDPPFIHHLLKLCVHAIHMGFEACLDIIKPEGYVCHYNEMAMPVETPLKLSEDTTTLLCAAHIEEYATPYTHMALKRWGGGYIHYCGKNPHLYAATLAEGLARGLNHGNPEMHDTRRVLDDLRARRSVYYGALPRRDGEGYDQYFARLFSSEKPTPLLLSMTAPLEECGRVYDAFLDATRY